MKGKQLAGSLALAAAAGAAFILARALGRLVEGKLREMGDFLWSGPAAGLRDNAAIPVIVSSDGRGPGPGGAP